MFAYLVGRVLSAIPVLLLVAVFIFFAPTPKIKTPGGWAGRSGAGEGIRTLDVNLGKVALYH